METDGAGDQDSLNIIGEFQAQRRVLREKMGGSDRIDALHAAGRSTARERIDALLDPDSFQEIGTFASSPRDPEHTPGDGKICGFGFVDARPVAVVADDATVKRASSSPIGSAKVHRVFAQALRAGRPLVYFGECSGGRLPDILGATGFTQVPPDLLLAQRQRRIPLVTAILGDSFGGSSFVAAVSDVVVQVRGTCLAVTSEHVVAAATGESVSREVLGGVDTTSSITGVTDVVVDTEEDAIRRVSEVLSYLPSNAWTPPPRANGVAAAGHPDELEQLVPRRRNRGYDMREVLRRIVDGGEILELAPFFGRGLITVLARIDGRSVGILASQPFHEAGTLGPASCDKATRMICLCDAFGLPLIFVQDTPGFVVGSKAEHERLLSKAMLMQQALALAKVPKITLIVRKAFGLAYFALGGNDMGTDLVCAWPGAEIGFMDTAVAAAVLGDRANEALEDHTMGRYDTSLLGATSPLRPAQIMKVDEVIAPAETRGVIIRTLEGFDALPFSSGADRPLAAWPVRW
jgi:acetyl-CoA carboxylase carboxyltransferase component